MEIDNYYLMSKQISEKLSENIVNYFNTEANRLPLYAIYHDMMRSWCKEAEKNSNYNKEFSLSNFVWYILSTEMQGSTVDILRSKFYSLRRDRKRYYFKTVKTEMENGENGKLHEYCERVMDMQKKMDKERAQKSAGNDTECREEEKRYSDFDEILNDKYQVCVSWAKNSDSDLITYLFFDELPEKRRAVCFLYDVSFRVFDFIKENYFSNAIDGYISQFPKFASSGVFSLKSGDIDLKYDVTDNSVSSYNEHYVTGKHGRTRVKDVVEVVNGDFSNIIEGGTKNALIKSMIEEGALSTEAKGFDSRDLGILGEVYSTFSIQDLASGEKVIPLSQFVKAAYPNDKLRQSTYEQTIDHIDHMSRANINMINYDIDDNPVSMSTINFFEVEYCISDSKSGSNPKPIGGRESVSQKEFLEVLKKQDMSKMYVKIRPSGTLRMNMKSNMNIKILSTLYNKIDHPKARNLLVLLQEKRTDIFPKTEVILDYPYMVERLKLEGVRKSVYMKELRQLFEMLKNKEFIKSYTLGTYNIVVDFKEMSDTERELYNLKNDNSVLMLEG